LKDVLNEFTAAGGDPSQTLAVELERAREKAEERSVYRSS
jgi:hypothetical protein